MMLPIISVLIGISLMYYIRQKRAEKEMDKIVNSISPSNNSSLKIQYIAKQPCAASTRDL